jgi:hypothetical protein
MHAGQVLVSDTPAGLTEKRGVESLEDAFVGYLEEAAGRGPVAEPAPTAKRTVPVEPATAERLPSGRNAQGWVQRSTQVELCLARGSGAEPRPDTPDAGVARQRDPDVHHGLRHHHGCGKPDLCRIGPRPDDRQPRSRAQSCRLALPAIADCHKGHVKPSYCVSKFLHDCCSQIQEWVTAPCRTQLNGSQTR